MTLAAVGIESGALVALIAVVGTMLIVLISILASAINTHTKTREFERSRREIAAYVAEGSISPDDAAKMLSAGKKPSKNA
mgnify:CR=1 FL=1